MFKRWFNKKQLLLWVFIIICAVGLSQLPFWTSFNEGWIEANIRHQGSDGIFYFLLTFGLITACGFPRQIAGFLAGYGFGFITGTVIATLAATMGCIISLLVAKFIARPLVINRFGDKIQVTRAFLNQQTFTKTIIIRLLPLGSNLIINLIAGVTKIKFLPFVGGSLVGYIPQMLIFALAGSGVEVMSFWQIVISVLLLAIAGLLTARLYKSYKTSITVNENILP